MVSVAATPEQTAVKWRDILRMLADVARKSPRPLGGLLLLVVFGNLRAGMYVLSLGGITQALIERDRHASVVWALMFMITGLVEQVYFPFKNPLSTMVEDTAAVQLQRRVLQKAANAPLEMFEQATFFNTLTRANDDLGQRATLIIAQFVNLIEVAVLFTGILAPVWLIDPRVVGLMLLGCFPVFLTTWSTARAYHGVKTRNASKELYASKVSDLLLQRDSAAEIRLFGTGPVLVKRWLATRTNVADDSVRALGTIARGHLVGEVFAAIGMGSAIALLVRLILQGKAELAALVTVIFAIVWGVDVVSSIGQAIRTVRENGIFLGDIFRFEAIADSIPRVANASAPPSNGPMAISLRRVSFHYPEADRVVLHNINLDIAPGEHIALLGENGAGKSTLVRLISGLYAPTGGAVLLDGLAPSVPRRDIGAVFQDFVRWQLPLRDNVGFGHVARESNDEAILAALEKSDLDGLVDELPDGLDSWLGREFGERDLSGGQWQRIAIARAFFREARLLILDEPTAALDPLAEQRLFERFRELAASKTAITISHRIGPARTADRIVVLDHGAIAEQGTHDELMKLDGLYAGMFRAQQTWYKANESDTTSADSISTFNTQDDGR